MKGVTEYRKSFVISQTKKYAVQLGIIPSIDDDSLLPTILFTTSEVEELSKQITLNGKILQGAGNCSTNYGACWNEISVIFINLRAKDMKYFKDIRHTIVHELIHYRFPKINHFNQITSKLYNKLIELVLSGKTDRDILDKENIIKEEKGNNKPLMYRENGTAYYNHSYKKIPKSQMKKVSYKIEIHKVESASEDTGYKFVSALSTCVKGEAGKPDVTARSKISVKKLLGYLKYNVRSVIYNNRDDIDITFDYDKTKDYNAMLLEPCVSSLQSHDNDDDAAYYCNDYNNNNYDYDYDE